MDALVWLRKQLEADDNDLLREMVRSFAEELMGAEADALCGAPYGEASPDRVNRRNGYRRRRWDTRTGSIDLRIPKLRAGSYFPDWLLDARSRSERAFIQVVAEAYVRGVSTRRVEGLVETFGITSLSKSQVSEMAAGLDEMVDRLPGPAPRRGPVYVCVGRRSDHEGPRGWPHRQRRLPVRRRGQRRRPPRDPRRRSGHRRRRGRLARLLPLPGRPRPLRRPVGDL